MKFNRFVSRITFFWTAFALSVFAVSMFTAVEFCPIPHNHETLEKSETRPAKNNIADVSTDNYAVYSAVLGQIRSAENFLVGEFVIDRDWHWAQYARPQNFYLSDHAVKDYEVKNQEMRKLRNEFGLPPQISLLSREEEDLLFPKGEGGWDRFYQTHPKARGIIYFSNVGFNKNKDEALVRVRIQSGYWSERSGFYILKKIEDKWLVEKASDKRIID